MDATNRPTCVFIGSACVGKTELLNACVLKQRELARIACDDAFVEISFEEARFGLDPDSGGQSSARAADCLAICVDVTDGRSLTDAHSYMRASSGSSTPALVFVLGTKADMVAERRVPMAALEEFATKWLLICPSVFDVSSENDVGIGLFLHIMASRLSSPRSVSAQSRDVVHHPTSPSGHSLHPTSQLEPAQPSTSPLRPSQLSSSTLGHAHHAAAQSSSPPPRHTLASIQSRPSEDMSPPPPPALAARTRTSGASSPPAAAPFPTTQHQHHADHFKEKTLEEEDRPLLRIEFMPGRTFEVDLIQFAQNTDIYIDRFVEELRDGGHAMGKTRSDIVRRIALALGATQEDVSPARWHKTESALHRYPRDPVVSRLEVAVGRETTAIFIVKEDDDVFAMAHAFCKQHHVHHKFAPIIALEALKSASLRQRIDTTRSSISPPKDTRSAKPQADNHASLQIRTSHASLQPLPDDQSHISPSGANDPLRFVPGVLVPSDASAMDVGDGGNDFRSLNAVDEDVLRPADVKYSDDQYMSRLRWTAATQ
eukprot:GEMP01032373.1.p1 GENE.GEMP01032373.1~~GEMP01032373.1.p1  ORF type:complete len:542 (+),score=149.69 GEMP01032373.1:51-1676(+)